MKTPLKFVAVSLLSAAFGFLAGHELPRRPPPDAVSPAQGPVPPPTAAPTPASIAVTPLSPPEPSSAAPHEVASGTTALNLQRVALDMKGNNAQACLVFSHDLSTAADFHPGDFLRFDPAVSPAIQLDHDRICLAGLAFGTQYHLTVLAGLPGADGARLQADDTLPLSLGDLPEHADFADAGFILPRLATQGLPIATVNLAKVHLRVDRITDRVLARTHLGDDYTDNNGEWDQATGQTVDTLGVTVWEGDLAVADQRNTKVVTAFPLASLLPSRLPGAYRITIAQPPDRDQDESDGDTTTRWVFNTDLMLTSHRGVDGLHVFVRSLASAKPVAGAQVALLAANNDELGRMTTDADGAAVFAAGLLRGAQGHTPRMVMAYDGDDFTVLQLDRPAFDFSDRGVDGRPDPGPVDGFLYTDRGIYRPGETIELGTIVRDGRAQPLPAGQAVIVTLRRPDGVESGHWRLVPNDVGLAVQPIVLGASAARGSWHLEEVLAGTKPIIGALDVEVQDFVPNQLAVQLTPRSDRIGEAPALIDVASRYLYGAPAADLQVSAHIQLQVDNHPIAAPGWSFGRDGESLNAQAQDIAGPQTYAQGAATLTIDRAALTLPKTTLPLRADITVAVSEPGGRATESQISLPVTTQDVLLGLRAPADGALTEDREAVVDAAAFAPDGTPMARHLGFRLVEQVTDYDFFSEDGQWQWKSATHDRPVTFGTLDVPAAGDGAPITLPPLTWGTYRLEITDATTGAYTSRILHVGFVADATGADSPEKVAVSLIGPAPRAGGVARLRIKPPFAGQMMLTVENNRVLTVQSAAIPAAGADISVPATVDWGVGAYVMASVYRPASLAPGHAPVRAVGLAYVKLDMSDQTLGVALQAPLVLRPRTHVDLGVTVTGKSADQDTWITVAAVDEGILQLTRFASPDPVEHFFGKRRLAVDMRDDYAHLIDGNGIATGEVRAGGDMDGAGLSVVPTRTTALFSGMVRTGADGHAVIPLDLPDFTGGLRLMVVATSARGFGHGELQVPVRDPVVAQLSLPRFLAPGDTARATLLLHNVEAPAGRFHIHIVADGALDMPPIDDDFTLAARQSLVRSYPLHGQSVGTGTITLALTGAGIATAQSPIMHDWDMQVRSAYQSETHVLQADQAAGTKFVLTQSVGEGLAPEHATVTASFSAIGGIDLPGLLAALDEYPFGCSEQLVSRAMPLLYVEQETALLGGVAPPDLRRRVQDAANSLLERQDDAGAFGLWRSGDGQAEPFLGAEILDFLTRARAASYAVPDHPLRQAAHALNNLDDGGYALDRFWDRNTASGAAEAVQRAGKAYALLLAARDGTADIADLRYMHDTELAQMEPLGQAQLGTGLALLGDRARAAHAFDVAESGLAQERDDLHDRRGDYYRTRLRDTAAAISLAAEIGDRPRVDRLLAALQRMDTRPEQLTTQEQGWLVIAAGVLLQRGGVVQLDIDGASQKPAAVVSLTRALQGLAPVTFANTGSAAIARVVSVRGLPLQAPAASASHITITKVITDADGKAVDLARLQQNQRLVVHLSGSVDDDAFHQTMIVDPLPAGFEIERVVAPSTHDTANGLPWLGDISAARLREKHDDRFMAAVDLGRVLVDDTDGGTSLVAVKDFNLAYVVRVVSPGQFTLPAASVRDMYRPDVAARGSVGKVTVQTPD